MTHRGPFQPLLFCDSVIPWFWPQADPCLCGWRHTHWLINYPGKLGVALGYGRAPHIDISRASLGASERTGQFLWLRDMRGPLPTLGLSEHLSSIGSTSFPSCVSHLVALSQFPSLCSSSLRCFARFQSCQRCSSELEPFLLWVSRQVHAFASNYRVAMSIREVVYWSLIEYPQSCAENFKS